MTFIKHILARRLSIPVEELDEDVLLEEYGIDSLYAIEFRKDFGKEFGKMPATLFFEYTTIAKLADYFIDTHYEKLKNMLQFEEEKEKEEEKKAILQEENIKHLFRVEVGIDDIFEESMEFSDEEDAIIEEKVIVEETLDFHNDDLIYDNVEEEMITEASLDGIAVIGMNGRYPMASNLEEFWDNLVSEKNCIQEIPKERWDYRNYYLDEGNKENITCTKWGGFIKDADKFDSLFFHIAPREAEKMDPQERIFMETVWNAVEDAGLSEEAFGEGNRAGLFVGVMNKDYELYGTEGVEPGRSSDCHSFYWSFANRISYFLNMQGPSMAVDTACSSSLVAVHLAVESLKSGDCEIAIAGGVNLLLHPSHLETLSKNHMLSSKDKCMCFSKDGDGLVIGEGVGAVVLKKLSQAKRDGDHIYGVIKAINMNSCGRISHYMVQNPATQTALVSGAYKKAGIDPRTVSYIEAQATGSHMGDVIEMSSLTKAFRQFTDDSNFCAVGSVKSNIGHLEPASGIAALTKVLLQMKYKKLIPTLHCEYVNEEIELDGSPFYLQKELKDWERPICSCDGVEKKMPRRAGISSFGAGGVDVHLVLEEYIEEQDMNDEGTSGAYIIPLSAKNEERLKEKARELLHFMDLDTVSLKNMAYTLQMGRKKMECRLAFVASDKEDIKRSLRSFLSGIQKDKNYFYGYVKKASEGSEFLIDGRAGEKFIQILIEDEELDKLACLWTKGIDVDWKIFHKTRKFHKISLPPYPFEKKRYWKVTEASVQAKKAAINNNYSKLVENVSTLQNVSFQTKLRKAQEFIQAHCVENKYILPAAVLLNIAISVGNQAAGKQVTALKDIILIKAVWVKNSEETIFTNVSKKENNIYFEQRNENWDIYTRGKFSFDKVEGQKKVDITALLNQQGDKLSKDLCYSIYREMGFNYGSLYQPIQALYYSKKAAVAELIIPPSENYEEFHVHPSILDGMIQSIIGILYANSEWKQTYVPFSFGELKILEEIQGTRFYAHAIRTEEGNANKDFHHYNIDLYREDGVLLLEIKNYIGKIKEVKLERTEQKAEFIKPIWVKKEGNADSKSLKECVILGNYKGQNLNCDYEFADSEEDYNKILKDFQRYGKDISQVLYLWNHNEAQASYGKSLCDMQEIIWRITELMKALLKMCGKQAVYVMLVYMGKRDEYLYPFFSAVDGFIRTITKENHNFHMKLLAADVEELGERKLIEVIEREASESHWKDMFVVYESENNRENRYVKEFVFANCNSKNENIVLKDQGVYLITGGLGGVGTAFAASITLRYNTVVILTGRQSILTEEKQQILEKLNKRASIAIYECCDCTDKDAVKCLIEKIRNEYGHLDGIIHAAGIVEDGLFLRKKKETFWNVCSTKVAGTINLDEATKDIQLDFFVCCSSTTALVGYIGQSDYAYANSFMDAYMAYRDGQKRTGKSLSVNWGFWAEGGMHVPETGRKHVEETMGITGMHNEIGVKALDSALQSNECQLAVVTGNTDKIGTTFQISTMCREKEKQEVPAMSKEEIITKIEERIISVCAEILKVEEDDLDVEEELDNYGLDSIIMIALMQKMEEAFEEILEPNILANENTIHKLALYLYECGIYDKVKNSAEDMKAVEYERTESPVQETEKVDIPMDFVSLQALDIREDSKQDDKIAIISMSCHFPKSPTLEVFWENLKNGMNMVSEVTNDRMDLEKFYSKNKEEPNKSYTKYAGLLDDIYGFDATYFGIQESEAAAIDPYHRMLLELSDELFKRAGYLTEELNGSRTGVYIGGGESSYFNKNLGTLPQELIRHIIVNTIPNMMSARISDYYNFKGPALTVDTACSSTLVALHQACQGIRLGDCDMAVVGGVELILNEYFHVAFSKSGILTKGKKAYVFDERADGTVLGEGAGLILLKSYERAIEDGDQILAVIHGTAVNNDGHTMGLTVPSLEGQKEVIEQAVLASKVSPKDITYLETHGTGTLLGDPIEIKAATEVYRKYTNKKQFCAVGSVKSNMGHLLRAAGMAGIIKIILSLQNKIIPPTLNCNRPHPRFRFEESPFYPIVQAKDWEAGEHGRFAAISAFGFGGTNCHVIIGDFSEEGYLQRRVPLPLTHFRKKQYRLGYEQKESMHLEQRAFSYGEPYLKDHLGDNPFEYENNGAQVLFGVTHFSMAVDAAVALCNVEQNVHIHKLLLSTPVTLYPGENVKVYLQEDKQEDGSVLFSSFFKKNCDGIVQKAAEGTIQRDSRKIASSVSVQQIISEYDEIITGDAIYTGREALRGESLRSVLNIYVGKERAVGEIKLTAQMKKALGKMLLHPALLDAGFIISMRGIKEAGIREGRMPGVWIPVMVKELYVYQSVPSECICQIELSSLKRDVVSFHYTYLNMEGKVLAELKDFTYKYVYYDSKQEQEKDAKEYIRQYILKKLGGFLNVPAQYIKQNENFMNLGIDSISLIHLSKEMEQDLNIEFFPTLFFEYQNVNELADYFETEFKEVFLKHWNKEEQGKPSEYSVTKAEDAIFKYVDNAKDIVFGCEENEVSEIKAKKVEDVHTPIAIIGMSGRFSGADNLTEFWENIRDSKSMITEIPKDHWDYKDWYDENRQALNKTYSKWGSFIPADKFDPAFFGISPREATWLDPQLRQLMEVTYSAMEDAGYAGKLEGTNTGVFVGSCLKDYWDEVVRRHISIDDYQGNSSLSSSLSGRLSYQFDLQGISMNIDHACASSLSAIHMACKAIQHRQCDMAIAAGVNLILSPLHYLNASRAQALSPTGRCHSFDVDADGYVPGEGVGVLLLKPLAQAIVDGDRIHAVIRGTATNHNGKANNPTSPRTELQEKLLLDAWKGVPPETISYIETHGTGTKLGDPIEINALNNAFHKHTDKEHFCAVGTVKSNIGHLEGAAGIAGVIKTILCMKHKTIVKMPEFHQLNPYLKLEHAPIYINSKAQYWETENDVPRRAGVSAFGLTGNNAHILLEEYNDKTVKNHRIFADSEEYIFILSAKYEERLKAYAENFVEYFEQLEDMSQREQIILLRNICYTMAVKRERMEERFGCVVSNLFELKEGLSDYLAGKEYKTSKRYNVELADKLDKWKAGESINLESIFDGKNASIISLPTYPFAKERYWLPEVKLKQSNSMVQINDYVVKLSDNDTKQTESVVYLDSVWEESNIAVGEEKKGVEDTLILDGIGSYAVPVNANQIVVRFGDTYDKNGNQYVVQNGSKEDFASLFGTLNQDYVAIKNIVYFPTKAVSAQDASKEVLNVQAFLKGMKAIKLQEVKHLFIVYGKEDKLESAYIEALGGYSLSLGNVLPNIDCRTIELSEWSGYEEAFEAIDKELMIDDGSPLVRYENNIRFVRKIKKVSLEHSGKTLLKADGTYLITGGLGGIGTILASYIGKTYHARLVLLGRSKLNFEKEQRLEQLRKQGLNVVYYATDITDIKEIQRIIALEKESGNLFNGVIHAAGTKSSGDILLKSQKEVLEVLHPKINGLIALDKAFVKETLDFFCVCSSNAAVLGDSGQCDYSVANRFMDCFMEHRNELEKKEERSGKSLIMNWPLWKNGGMHLELSVEKLYLKSSGMSYLENEDGIKAFTDLLASGKTRLSVIAAKEETIQKILRRQENIISYDGKLEKDLTAFIAEVVEMDFEKVKKNMILGNMGFDSISLKELAEKLSGYFNIKVSPAVFFTATSVEKIMGYLKEHYKENIEEFYSIQNALQNREEEPRKQEIEMELEDKQSVSVSQKGTQAIAIIGAAGKLPGSKDLNEYWKNLLEGKDLVTEIPAQRWNLEEYYYEEPFVENKTNSKWGGFIEDAYEFDAKFFNISKHEAELMDPQHRIFLQVVYTAIENAGYCPSALSGKEIGVFGGIQFHDYERILEAEGLHQVQIGTGNSASMLCNRISYLLDIKGPSEAVDTACSSSMVAVHRAVKSIQAGECEMAIAGGVSLLLTPYTYLIANQTGALSPDGHCHTFDEKANGYVKGEGTGAVILKPLEQAVKDGDHIYAVIRGSAENHGGRANSPTAPNPEAQAEVIKKAYLSAGIHPDTVTYIETHGTGTQLGDPVEIEGLKSAFSQLEGEYGVRTKEQSYCGLGSVKTNIGHLEPASGIASLLKLILALEYKMLPASIHFNKLNPYIQLEHSPFYIVDKTKEWKAKVDAKGEVIPRRAGVSSFGFGGSNVHMVLEEYVEPETTNKGQKKYVFVFSAKTKNSLKRYCESFLDYLEREKEHLDLERVAFTLSEGREQREVRLAILASNVYELMHKLKEYCEMGKSIYQSDGTEMQNVSKENNLNKLAQSFVKGDTFYHKQFDGQKHIKRSPLPAYCFEQQKFCVKEGTMEIKNNHRAESKEVMQEKEPVEIQELLYLPEWKIDGTIIDDTRRRIEQDRILILYPESAREIMDSIEKKCIEAHVSVQSVRMEEWEELDYDIYKEGKTEIYFLGGLYNNYVEGELTVLEESREKGILPLFHLVKKLSAYGLRNASITIKVLTFNVCDVKKEEHICPYDACMHGFLMSVAREYQDWSISTIDCNREELCQSLERQRIIAYITGHLADEIGIRAAIRNGFKYTIRIHPCTLPEKSNIPFREKGVYVIFGGAGGIGLELSLYMAKTVSAKIALVGRSNLSKEKLEKIRVIEEYGGQVMYVQADMNNLESTKRTVERIKERFGIIHGVIHSALVLKDSAIDNMDEQEFLSVLEPKVRGCVVLGEVFKNETLDFMLFFSAAQSFYGNGGQSNYAAACMFKDVYSKYIAQKTGSLVRTINWGFWGSVGVVASDKYRKKVGRQGAYSIEPAEGMEIIKQILNHNHQQILAIKADKGKLYQMLPIEEDEYKKKEQKEEVCEVEVRDDMETESVILDVVADVIDVEQGEIGVEEAYKDLGIDSILAIEVADKLNKMLQIKLKPTDLFNYGNINTLAKYINQTWEHILIPKKFQEKTVPSAIEIKSVISTVEQEQTVQNMSIDAAHKVAIIGMSGRFPNVENMYDLWKKLKEGFDGVSEIKRWDEDETFQAVRQTEESHTRWGAFLEDIDQFDPLFFNISPKEAEQMDPQQRIFLEETWKAFEDAGYSGSELGEKKCGVFLGYNGASYYELMEKNNVEQDSYAFLGNSEAIMAARISYFLNLKGPSITINTACSSSLVAIHLARESILSGTSDMAVAGGVMIMVTPMFYRLADATGMLSAEGRCKAFDQKANGIAPGECVAAVIMKRLDKAIEDGDHIYGVIEGSEMNQDGRTNGITAPSEPSQTELECAVYDKFHINPEKISYIEAHGTGTKLGDPIEIDALTAAFRRYTENKRYCAVGSIKTNFGHSLAGAGVSGIIKILLCMKYKQLVPSIHCEQENELLHLKDSPFYINKQLRGWEPAGGDVRYAAINSFGLSGTNAHIVLREATAEEKIQDDKERRKVYLIPLSARNKKSILKKARELTAWIKTTGNEYKLRDISYTLMVGRSHFQYRICFAVSTVSELIEQLDKVSVENIVNLSGKRESIMRNDIKSEEDMLEVSEDYDTLIEFYLKGHNLDWVHFYKGDKCKRISMPTYPFDRKRYWIEKANSEYVKETNQFHPLIDENDFTTKEKKFHKMLKKSSFYLRDHVIAGKETLPGVVHIAMAKAASELSGAGKVTRLSNIVWMKPVLLEDAEKDVTVYLKGKEAYGEIKIHSFDKDGAESIHTQIRYGFESDESSKKAERIDIESIKKRCHDTMYKEECYECFKNSGINYGPTFQTIQKIYKNDHEALSVLGLSEQAIEEGEDFELHPSILDGAFQSTLGLKNWISTEEEKTFIPFSITELVICQKLKEKCYVYVRPSANNKEHGIRRFDLVITDLDGTVLLKIHEYTMRKIPNARKVKSENNDSYILEILRKLKEGEISLEETKQLVGGAGWKKN